MDLPEIATPQGYPHLKYAAVERERRWLCESLPDGVRAASDIFDIDDLYIADSLLRLRSAQPRNGTTNFRRLTKKTDFGNPGAKLLTTIYLDETEYTLLAKLNGLKLSKTRYRVSYQGYMIAVDEFRGALDGLVLCEIEFDDDITMNACPAPAFAVREVTADPAYSGYALARRTNGLT